MQSMRCRPSCHSGSSLPSRKAWPPKWRNTLQRRWSTCCWMNRSTTSRAQLPGVWDRSANRLWNSATACVNAKPCRHSSRSSWWRVPPTTCARKPNDHSKASSPKPRTSKNSLTCLFSRLRTLFVIFSHNLKSVSETKKWARKVKYNLSRTKDTKKWWIGTNH